MYHKNETAEVIEFEAVNGIIIFPNQSYLSELETKWKKIQINNLNGQIGFMLAAKALMQLVANLFVGPLTTKLVLVNLKISSIIYNKKIIRIGYRIPMFAGFFIMFTSTLSIIILCLNSYSMV